MTVVSEMPSDAVDHYADILAAVATSLADGDVEGARTLLEPIAGQVWAGRVTKVGRSEIREPGEKRARLLDPVRAAVFLRDDMLCTFCLGRAIPLPVLVAIGDVFPGMLAYNTSYSSQGDGMHPAYWALVAEADHVHAHSRGGGNDPTNLSTIHALCNTAKSDLMLEDMQPRPMLQRTSNWDGLVSRYADVVAIGNVHGKRQHSLGYHQKWLRYLGGGSFAVEVDPGA